MNESSHARVVDPNEFHKWIIFEDPNILVLNKPGWLVCHPSKNGPWSSLVGASKEYLGVDSIHLASRLDRETSGVVLMAKHRGAASRWQKGIETKMVRRTYLAIMRGELQDSKNVSSHLGKDPNSAVFVKQRVMKKSNTSKRAETTFNPLLFRNERTFCLVRTKTGRKHQIRAHAQWIGHELVGEKLYGPDEKYYLHFCKDGWSEKWLGELGMKRQGLHGRSLGFEGDERKFFADLPEDMREYLKENLKISDLELNELIKQADEMEESKGLEELSCAEGGE